MWGPSVRAETLLLLDLVEGRWYFPCMLTALICLVFRFVYVWVHMYVCVCVPVCMPAYVYVCQRVTSVIGPLV